jgi:RNA polymerase sigma factor (sigma-70 family)
MGNSRFQTVLQHLRRTTCAQVSEGVADAELLQRFVRERDEAAFELLVWRHERMVLGVCRRFLHDPADAEDAFQATFLALVCKAGSITQGQSLAAWLHKVACRAALRAARSRARRRAVVKQPEDLSMIPARGDNLTEVVWRDLAPLLHEELSKLPEKYRAPLVLCYLEGKTYSEAAQLLNCPRGTLSIRLKRGRDLLRKRLAGRGLALTAGVLATALCERAASAAMSAGLVASTLKAALYVAEGNAVAGVVSAQAATLTEGMVHAMFVAKLKLVILALLLSLGAVLTVGGWAASRRANAAPRDTSETKPAVAPPRAAQNNPPAVQEPDTLAKDEEAVAAHIKALHDADSETRATAAAALRRIVARYPSRTVYLASKDGGESVWQKKVDQVKPGMTKAEVQKILPPFPESDGFEHGSGDSHIVNYRIDYHWTVTVSYRNPDRVIERPTLTKRALPVPVTPPANFTGTWINWHVNGQPGHEIHYQDGQYHGAFTSFHDNGAKHVEQHYTRNEAHGADTGWYSNGKMSYTGQYRNGKQDGKWIHWYPNGKKQSESNYDNGKHEGRDARWDENGQLRFERTYKNGVKHGIEASWDERGNLEYEREYNDGVLVDR